MPQAQGSGRHQFQMEASDKYLVCRNISLLTKDTISKPETPVKSKVDNLVYKTKNLNGVLLHTGSLLMCTIKGGSRAAARLRGGTWNVLSGSFGLA